MGREYWGAMDKVRATEDWKARTLSALAAAETAEAERPRRGRSAGRVLCAAAACGLLFAAAVAASPGLREALTDALGPFAPYSAEPEGASATDQGVEVRAVSALSDGNVARCYLSVQDKTGDRLGEHTVLDGVWMERPGADYVSGSFGNGYLVSYDPETRTALYALRFSGNGPPAQGGTLEVAIGGLQPEEWRVDGTIPKGVLTAAALETRTLETGAAVLAPEQTPADIGGVDCAALSSLGFGSDGLLHVQFRLGDELDRGRSGVAVTLASRSTTPEQHDRLDRYNEVSEDRARAVKFESGGHCYVDLRYQVEPSDLGDVVVEKVRVTAVQGEAVQGEWKLSIPLEDVPHRRFGLEEQVGLVTVKALDLTTLGLSAESDPAGGPGTLSYPAAVFLSDGAVVTAGMTDSGFHADGYTANHWSFDEPIDPEKAVGVAFGLWYIPLDGDTAGPGRWLEELPGTE